MVIIHTLLIKNVREKLLAVRALLLVASLVCGALFAADWRDDAALEAARSALGPQAISHYRELLKKYPEVPALQSEAADVFYEEKLFSEALVLYERAVSQNWKPARTFVRIGKCHEKLKQPAEAEAVFRKALSFDAASVAAQFGLATALFNQNRSSQALPIFETLTQRNDEWGSYAREFLAHCRFDTGDYDGAVAIVRLLLAQNPSDRALRWLLARSLYKGRRYKEALDLFETVAREEPARAVAANYYAAVCLENLGEKQAAEKRYESLRDEAGEWGREARASAGRIAGKTWNFLLDYSGGYDTNVLQAGVDERGTGEKDAYNQTYALIEGRLARSGGMSFWLGAEHFSLLYPELHENDYIQHAGKATLYLPGAGPVTRFALEYQFRFAELDYHSYRQEQRGSLTLIRETKSDRLRVLFGGADNTYFGDASNLSGPDALFTVDYTRRLPAWDHQVRLRFFNEYRWTDDETLERLSQRVRLQYRAQVWSIVSGQIEGSVRRDDFPESDGAGSARRTDLRLTGEVQFDAQVKRNLSINWGYLYESQSSSRQPQEYKRHQLYAGFTVSF